ncbi:NmrA domain-containing protein [Fusarium sp. Ph1]|nr:NmrA domain-containing protein [Fusarium sp. Ph1]
MDGTPGGTSSLGPHDQARKATRDFLRSETNLAWTRFICGHFLIDYAGQPYIKSYMKPDLHFGIDVANKAASIPGTGNDIIAFSYTYDLAKFVVAALDLPEWKEETIFWSDKATWNEVVALAEKASGTKFTVNYDPVEKLKKGEISELPGQGHWNLPEENSLNRRFPEIETLKVKDAFKGWEGK